MQTPTANAPVCITCSDQAVRARIIELRGGGLALADVGAAVEEISVDLIDAAPGDIVLVHARVAIARLEELPPQSEAPRT